MLLLLLISDEKKSSIVVKNVGRNIGQHKLEKNNERVFAERRSTHS